MAAREFRIALTVQDYPRSLSFYRDVLGLSMVQEWPSAEGHGALLSPPAASLEILDVAHASWVDQVEAGERLSGQVRFALQFHDLAGALDSATTAGARLVRGPMQMPWKDTNARLLGPDGIQMTFFTRPD